MPTVKYRRWENRPALTDTVPLSERLRSVHVLTANTLQEIDLYLYDNDLADVSILDLARGIPSLADYDNPKHHIHNHLVAGYLYVTRRDEKNRGRLSGRRYVTLSNRGRQVLNDLALLRQQTAEHRALELAGA